VLVPRDFGDGESCCACGGGDGDYGGRSGGDGSRSGGSSGDLHCGNNGK